MRTLILTAICSMVLAACGQVVYSNVSVFHELGEGTKPTYALLPFKEQEGSLEHKTYENLARQQLNAKGYREAPLDRSDVIVFLQYGIDEGRQMAYSYPIMGRTGTSSSYTTGTVQSYGSGYATYSGTTDYTPTYGVVGAGTGTHTVFARFLRVDFVDRATLASGTVKKQYEGTVSSRGSSGQLSAVMPTMIRALFEDFPGKSGTTKSVTLPLDQ
jgi:hypothetical protein